MSAKIQNKKSICTKNKAETLVRQPCDIPEIYVPSRVIAYVAGCSESNVKKVLRGEQSGETRTRDKIEVASILFEERLNLLVQEVKRIVNF